MRRDDSGASCAKRVLPRHPRFFFLCSWLFLGSCAAQRDRKRGNVLLGVLQVDAGRHGTPRKNVVGQQNLQPDPGQHRKREDARHQNSGQQARQHQIQQIVSGVQACNHQHKDQGNERHPLARQLVVQADTQPLQPRAAGQIRNGGEGHVARQPQRLRGTETGGNDASLLRKDAGVNRQQKRQGQCPHRHGKLLPPGPVRPFEQALIEARQLPASQGSFHRAIIPSRSESSAGLDETTEPEQGCVRTGLDN